MKSEIDGLEPISKDCYSIIALIRAPMGKESEGKGGLTGRDFQYFY